MRIRFAVEQRSLGLTLVATERLVPEQIEAVRVEGMRVEVQLDPGDCLQLLGGEAALGECVLVMRLQAIEPTPPIEIETEIETENERSEER